VTAAATAVAPTEEAGLGLRGSHIHQTEQTGQDGD
jgi:hypothetical protein